MRPAEVIRQDRVELDLAALHVAVTRHLTKLAMEQGDETATRALSAATTVHDEGLNGSHQARENERRDASDRGYPPVGLK